MCCITVYNPLLRLYKYCVGIIKPFLLPSAPPFADICKTLHVVVHTSYTYDLLKFYA